MDNARRKLRQIQAAVDAQIYLDNLEREVSELRERFRQWCREAEIGLRMLIDGNPTALA